MGGVDYAALIRSMTWSWSRAKSFDDCPYGWFLRYISRREGSGAFFATYGTLMHSVIDRHYKEGLSPAQMLSDYLRRFPSEVEGEAPSVGVFQNYFRAGADYFRAFTPFPLSPLATEQRVDFLLDGIPVTGIIDFVGRGGDGGLVIIDNKSRALSPRSGRKKPTKADAELDDYLRQLYLYSEGARQLYGELPSHLCFNCFRTGAFIKERFDMQAFENTKRWFAEQTERIAHETRFRPRIRWFWCSYLCGYGQNCEYFKLYRG